MSKTRFLEWEFPSENEDPYFEKISELYSKIDDATFGVINTACNLIIPAPSITWVGGTKTLTWTGDFEVPLMRLGFSLKVQYGPDGVNKSVQFLDGERLIIVVPRTSGSNVTANFQKVSGNFAISHGLFTVGFCRGSAFYANFPQVYT